MDTEAAKRFEELTAKMDSEGLTATEREEYRLLEVQHLADMIATHNKQED